MQNLHLVRLNSFVLCLSSLLSCITLRTNKLNAIFLVFSASSDINVWTDGLLVFYEVFRFLEENLPDELLPRDFHRTKAFEDDLSHYLGDDWKDKYTIRPSVKMYLDHLTDVNNQHPILLLAYVYHLYMGLLSGGQILQKKRALFRSSGLAGQAVTHFPDHTIGELKTQMRDLINTLADDFDESTKTLLIAESRMVFHLNNELVRSVNGVNWASLRKFAIIMAVVVGVFYILRFD